MGSKRCSIRAQLFLSRRLCSRRRTLGVSTAVAEEGTPLTRETTQQGVQDTTQGPHVDTFAVSLVLDDFRRSVPDRAAGRHGLLIPDDLAQAEIGNLDTTDTATSDSGSELSFIFLLLVVWSVDGLFRRDDRDPLKQQVFRLDVSVDDTTLFVQISDPLGYLNNDVS